MNPSELQAAFKDRFGMAPKVQAKAPGRVNILGEHVDYNGGVVMPAAIDRNVHILAIPRKDTRSCLHALDFNQQVEFQYSDLDIKTDIQGDPLPQWALYPAGVAWSLLSSGYKLPGVDAVYTSDIPIGAGLSSSAAVEVGFAAIYQQLSGFKLNRLNLAKLCQQAENQYVGVSSGLMDQFASACGVEGHVLVFDTRSLEWEAVALPEDTALIIADSGIRRSLKGSEYNERRAACEAALEYLKAYMPSIQSLRDVPSTEFAAYAPYLPEIPRKRAEHVIKEIQRVESAIHALKREDKQALGALLYAGHASLKNLYEVSTPELDTLVNLSRTLPGCLGARLTGAGFGGCTIQLVDTSQADSFIEGLKQGYLEATGNQTSIYLCRASQGATVQTARKR